MQQDISHLCTPLPGTATTSRLWGYTHGEGFENRPDWGDTPERRAAEAAENKAAVLAMLFGHLVQLAAPVVEHYHSDLFRDAQWLQAKVNGPRRFVWQAYECGTVIDDVNGSVHAAAVSVNPERRFYLVELTHDDGGAWNVTISQLPLPSEVPAPALAVSAA